MVRTGGNDGKVSVRYRTEADTATEGEDFTSASGRLDFADGESSQNITVSLKDDELGEDSETLKVILEDPTGGAVLSTPYELILTILDNDAGASSAASSQTSVGDAGAVGFSAVSYGVSEDAGSLTIRVQRTGGTQGEVSVKYATTNGTASGNEYTATNGTLTFGSGDSERSFTVDISDNDSIGGNKSFSVSLSEPTGGVVLGAVSSADVNIADDEILASGTGSFKFDDDDYEVTEGDELKVTIIRQSGYRGEASVNYSTTAGSAKSPSDFTSTSGTLSFQDGEARKTITIATTEDNNDESTEAFTLIISSPTNGAELASPSTAYVNILD